VISDEGVSLAGPAFSSTGRCFGGFISGSLIFCFSLLAFLAESSPCSFTDVSATFTRFGSLSRFDDFFPLSLERDEEEEEDEEEEDEDEEEDEEDESLQRGISIWLVPKFGVNSMLTCRCHFPCVAVSLSSRPYLSASLESDRSETNL
jgi:hypothetical protein